MAEPQPLPDFTASDIARFWAKVAISGPDDCWEWQGGKQKGYGYFKVSGKQVKAHRVAYFLSTGKNPSTHLACHSCDNPPCCNPRHLFPGTHLDNQRDCASKGRKNSATGSNVGSALLTDGQVTEIRSLYETGLYKQSDLAVRFGCSRRTISAIVRGQNWKHLPTLATKRRRVA